MKHTLVIPSDLIDKLEIAHGKESAHTKWLEINVNTVEDMLNRIKERLNDKNPKLEITDIRVEEKTEIKRRINNSGTASKFTGYFENENNSVVALFFYIDPDAGNANDFVSSKMPPVLLGIYRGFADSTKDLHINNMPIYLVSLCTTSRVNNASVKQQIICAETIGVHYVDVFDNRLYDIMNDGAEDIITKISSVEQLQALISQNGANDYFEIIEDEKKLKIKCENVLRRTNDTAYVYRWFLRVIPAVYLASNQGYMIDVSAINAITNSGITIIRKYIEKFN